MEEHKSESKHKMERRLGAKEKKKKNLNLHLLGKTCLKLRETVGGSVTRIFIVLSMVVFS